ncbi:intermembrane transport protein PqiB [Piscinibacter sp.]|uniref:PqiB family protein n=1 Tax=Piscinibacter sp. TaxID=1903157 RepID=UPI002C9A3ACA|nr:MlaD family protein [Albitalea sp.]HUG25119.1 MlaD family protein [Albitalea sp.]
MTEPTDTPPGAPTPAPPPVIVEPVPAAAAEPVVTKKNPARLSLVWIVPLLAMAIGASLLINTLMKAGPQVLIEFRTAEGLEPGKTEVRYKEVIVGRVESVQLGPDRQRVLVGVRLNQSVANIAVEDTQFWVVRPRIGTAGVSGLGTLLSGAYIGVDAGESETPRKRFIGLEAPPFVLRGEPGRTFVLLAPDLGSLEIGSPVYYRRARVGRVSGYTLDPHRDELTVQVFIESPYEPLVTGRARFWNASGLDLSLNASGLTLNTQTLVSVLAGGIAFERWPGTADAPPAPAGSRFYLFPDRRAAVAPPDGPPLTVRMVFDHSVRGLAVGAAIDFLGIEIGTVQAISPQYDAKRNRYPMEVTADIYPLRLGGVRDAMLQDTAADPAADLRFLKMLVEHGLRAQLHTGNLLTGQQYVALDFAPKARRATLDMSGAVPLVPSVPGTLSELQPQIAEIVAKISKVPFEEIGRDLQATLSQARKTIGQLTPQAQEALAEVERTLQSVQESLRRLDRNVLDGSAPMQRNVEQTMSELQRAAQSLRMLGDYLQRHPEAILRGKPADPVFAPKEKTR